MCSQGTWFAWALVVAALATTAACGLTATSERAEPAPPAADAAAEREALFWARIDSASTRFTEADVRFMTDMIVHHAQAIAMSRLVPDRAESSAVRTLASRIINAQQDEIEIMQVWLRDRGQPVPEVRVEGTTTWTDREHERHHDDHGHADMPGMLSPEAMRTLERASGADFDRLFLSHMIEHHRGAVIMVRELFATDGAGQDPTVFKFGSDVQVDQTTEIARMERLLAEISARRPSR